MKLTERKINSLLRQHGYKLTPQRRAVIQVVTSSNDHLTPNDIYEKLREKYSGTGLVTIYRTLDLLWQEGFACRSDLSEGKTVYAAIEHGPHIHLVCRRCNQVIDADSDALNSLNSELQDQYGFDPDLDHFSIFGVCSECREK